MIDQKPVSVTNRSVSIINMFHQSSKQASQLAINKFLQLKANSKYLQSSKKASK
jgi:hypothetical protein